MARIIYGGDTHYDNGASGHEARSNKNIDAAVSLGFDHLNILGDIVNSQTPYWLDVNAKLEATAGNIHLLPGNHDMDAYINGVSIGSYPDDLTGEYCSVITANAAAGQPTITVSSVAGGTTGHTMLLVTLPEVLGEGSSQTNYEILTVSSVNATNKTITFTANLTRSYTANQAEARQGWSNPRSLRGLFNAAAVKGITEMPYYYWVGNCLFIMAGDDAYHPLVQEGGNNRIAGLSDISLDWLENLISKHHQSANIFIHTHYPPGPPSELGITGAASWCWYKASTVARFKAICQTYAIAGWFFGHMHRKQNQSGMTVFAQGSTWGNRYFWSPPCLNQDFYTDDTTHAVETTGQISVVDIANGATSVTLKLYTVDASGNPTYDGAADKTLPLSYAVNTSYIPPEPPSLAATYDQDGFEVGTAYSRLTTVRAVTGSFTTALAKQLEIDPITINMRNNLSVPDGTVVYVRDTDQNPIVDDLQRKKNGAWERLDIVFNDTEGDPAPIGTTSDGTSMYAARRDHAHTYARDHNPYNWLVDVGQTKHILSGCFSQNSPARYGPNSGNGTILLPGASGAFDDTSPSIDWVIKHNNQVLAFYRGTKAGTGPPTQMCIHYAEASSPRNGDAIYTKGTGGPLFPYDYLGGKRINSFRGAADQANARWIAVMKRNNNVAGMAAFLMACPFASDPRVQSSWTLHGKKAVESVAPSTNELIITNHGLATNNRAFVGAGTYPGGLDGDTLYYVIYSTANSVKLSLTQSGSAVDITSAGSGVSLYMPIYHSVTADQHGLAPQSELAMLQDGLGYYIYFTNNKTPKGISVLYCYADPTLSANWTSYGEIVPGIGVGASDGWYNLNIFYLNGQYWMACRRYEAAASPTQRAYVKMATDPFFVSRNDNLPYTTNIALSGSGINGSYDEVDIYATDYFSWETNGTPELWLYVMAGGDSGTSNGIRRVW